MKTINEVLGALVLDGMTKAAVAERLGITGDTLANKTKGVTDWKWGEVLTICELAGVRLDELDPHPTKKEEE